jgi:hypothetical protein
MAIYGLPNTNALFSPPPKTDAEKQKEKDNPSFDSTLTSLFSTLTHADEEDDDDDEEPL